METAHQVIQPVTNDVSARRRLNAIRVAVLALVVLLTAVLFIFHRQVSHLGVYGYPGIFLLSIIANATIILPVPGVVLTSVMGAVFNPALVALAAGSGATLGELSGYLAGFSGQMLIENQPRYDQMVGWMKKYGDFTIFILALIPNPAFDLAGMTAGALKLPVWRFLFWAWLGKLGKMLIFAYAGASLIHLINFH
jgi:membrane protein DedA with SNARE-associated domain